MTPHRQIRIRNEALRFAVLLGLLASMVMLGGCNSSVKGGSSLHSSSDTKIHGATEHLGFTTLKVNADGSILIESARTATTQPTTQTSSDYSATTQPSASSNGKSLPRLSMDEDGGWAASFDQIKVPPKANWPLFLIFLAAAVALWQFTGQRLLAMGCLALGLLAVVWPAALGWLLLVTVIAVAVAFRKVIVELVRGASNALDLTSADQREQLKTAMAAKQDHATQRVVKDLK